MFALYLVLLAGGVLVCAALTIAGFRPAPPLASLKPEHCAEARLFAQSPELVADAYRRAASRTPGFRIVEYGPRVLYLDSRPTSRILAGDFGLLLLLLFDGDREDATRVQVRVQPKTLKRVRAHSVIETERALRMRAKQFGITELILDSETRQ